MVCGGLQMLFCHLSVYIFTFSTIKSYFSQLNKLQNIERVSHSFFYLMWMSFLILMWLWYCSDQQINNRTANATEVFIFIEQSRCKSIGLYQIAVSIFFLCFSINGQFKAISTERHFFTFWYDTGRIQRTYLYFQHIMEGYFTEHWRFNFTLNIGGYFIEHRRFNFT